MYQAPRFFQKLVFPPAVSLLSRNKAFLRPHPLSAQYHTSPSVAAFGHTIQPSNIVTSPYPDIEDSPLDLYRHTFQNFSKYGNKIGLVDGITSQEYSFNQIDELTSKFSSGLNRIGFKQRDVLSIVSPNLPAYAITFYGTLASGGAVNTCNPTFTAEELAYHFENSNARYVATVIPLLPVIQEAIKNTKVEKIILLDGGNSPSRDNLVSYQSLIEDSGSLFNPVTPDLNDTAYLPYSSGTTGLPKGVMLTHRNITSNLSQMHHPEVLDLSKEGTSLLALLPFFHVYGSILILTLSFYHGARLVTLPKFEPESFLRNLQDHKVTIGHLVPPLVLFMAKHPLVDQYDLSSIEELFTAAAPIGEEMVTAAMKRIGCGMIRQGYGLTEMSPLTHATAKSLGTSKPDSVGPCIRSLSTKIVDPETGEVLGPGKEGELLMKGPNIMKGYLNRPEATAECMTADGWFRSGDIGYFDNDGCFYITDRLKELIKVKGLQVAPAELEAVLVTHPKIDEAAVIGIPDEWQGESPKAYVVKKEEVSEKEVADFLASKLAPHKHLTGGVEFIDAIPKSASGKILRRLLRDQNK